MSADTTEAVLDSRRLAEFGEALLLAAGVPPATASLTAESLVAANLRGVDSHGVHLLPFYMDMIARGDLDPAASGHVISESGSCLHYHGENGIGQAIAGICCGHATRIAKSLGAAVVVARESNHFGAAAFWAQRICAAGHIGIVVCNASPMVPPWQAKEPRFGTNPICMSVPGDPSSAWLLDMATTTVAANKIYKAGVNGQQTIPSGWAMDSEGVPTTDTQAALKGLVMPLGGYKGSGLAIMVEILCAVLSGGAMSTELGGIRIKGQPMRVSQTYIAIDVARFMPPDEFRNRMDWLVERLKSAAPAKGYDEVLIAGEPEIRSEERRRREGIPIALGTWQSLLDTAARVGVQPPIFSTSATPPSSTT